MKKWLAALAIPVISGLIIFFITRALQSPEEEPTEPKIVIFEANPETIDSGQKSILRWKTENATEVTLNGQLVALSGNKHVRPQQRTLYKLTATVKGRIPVGETIAVEVTVPSPPKIVKFEANPDSIKIGEKSTLQWETQGAVKALLEGKAVALSGKKLVKPQVKHRYNLVAINEKGHRVEAFKEIKVSTPLSSPKITEFEAYPPVIIRGQKSTLHWRTKDANEIRLDGNFVHFEGDLDVTPQTTTIYRLAAKNEESKKVIKTAKVEVKIPKPPKIVEFSAEPLIVKRKEYSTLFWKTKDATEVTLNGKVVALSGKKKVSPTRKTAYELTAKNKEGKSVKATTEVEIEIPNPPQIIFFSADPKSVGPGETSYLSWATIDATKVRLEGEDVSFSGNKDVKLNKTTKYVLVVTNEGGKDTGEATVEVIKLPKITRFYATQNPIWKGDSCKLVWKTENATEARINGKVVPLSGSKMVRPDRTTTYILIVNDRAGRQRGQKTASVEVKEPPSPYHALLYSLTPQKKANDPRVSKAIQEILEFKNEKKAKMLLKSAGWGNGISLDLHMSKFRSGGGSMKDAQIMAAKLSRVGIRVSIYDD